nr:T9SS type A sorting domain-containing protein [Bacteroidota bacterium]
GWAFVAAQDSLAKVNLETGKINQIVALPGVNKFAVYQDKLIVSRQYPATSNFLQIRDAGDLTLIKNIPEISDESWEISVVGDSAYVSVAGGWAATEGKLAIVDLVNLDFVREINLGGDAAGIGPSYQVGNSIYFVCKSPWGATSGSVATYNILTAGYEVHLFPYPLGEGAGIYEAKLYLVMDGNIGVIDLTSYSIAESELIPNPFTDLEITACTLDTINEKLYVNYSYWIAPAGSGRIYDLSGNQTGEYEVGISAEEVLVQYVDLTAIPRNVESVKSLRVSPNPCADHLLVSFHEAFSDLVITDLQGKVLKMVNSDPTTNCSIDVSEFSAGMYVICVDRNGWPETTRFIKN